MTVGVPSRPNPRISVTKLGEYTDATPARRRAIVRDQREPRSFIVIRYERARRPIVDFFVGGAGDRNAIADQVGMLASATGSSDWQTQDLQLSAEALESFLDVYDELDLDGLTASAGQKDVPKLSISGVEVSVRPDLLLRGTYCGKRIVGAVKFHFSKTSFLTEDAGLNAATAIHQYVDTHIVTSGETSSTKHCAVLDVFAKKWYGAPTAYRMRRKTIFDACREVALWWPVA